MHGFSKSLIVAAMCGLGTAAQSGSPAVQHIVCPAELPSDAIQTGVEREGWRPYLKGPFRLEFAAPTAGPPEKDAELAYYTTTHTKTSRTNIYNLPQPHPGGIWVKCAYSPLGDISLHRQLDDSIEQCKITISNESPKKVDIQCK